MENQDLKLVKDTVFAVMESLQTIIDMRLQMAVCLGSEYNNLPQIIEIACDITRQIHDLDRAAEILRDLTNEHKWQIVRTVRDEFPDQDAFRPYMGKIPDTTDDS